MNSSHAQTIALREQNRADRRRSDAVINARQRIDYLVTMWGVRGESWKKEATTDLVDAIEAIRHPKQDLP